MTTLRKATTIALLGLVALAGTVRAADVELKDATTADLEKAVAAHKGKVVLIDVWGTSCIPCIQGFPKFVGLHEKYADKGLVCVSVAIQSKRDLALRFLKARKAAFPNYYVDGNVEWKKLFDAWSIAGAIPAKVLFDAKGKRVKTYGEKSTPEEVEGDVKKLLEGQSVSLRFSTTDQLIAEIAKNKGKVVMVDCWSTWCVPCIKKFPKFVAMHEKYKDKGLVCISVATQLKEEHPRALKFLTSQKATFVNVLVEQGDEETKLYKKLGIEGGIPALFVFDRTGKKHKQYGEGDEYEAIEKAVKELLSQE